MFLEYSSLNEAKEAVRAANGHRLDKNHVFAVNLFSDFEKYLNVPDEWTPPEPAPYKDPVCFFPIEILVLFLCISVLLQLPLAKY